MNAPRTAAAVYFTRGWGVARAPPRPLNGLTLSIRPRAMTVFSLLGLTVDELVSRRPDSDRA
jgi:hypothetical protein